MKAFTDLKQSKKLAEFLPIESADMYYYSYMSLGESFYMNCPDVIEEGQKITEKDIPCWSLASLLSILPIVYINNKKEVCGPLHIDVTDSETPFVLWYVNLFHKGNIVELKTKEYDNLVDACYEMIIMLHELNLL